jgi:hypothetical protein
MSFFGSFLDAGSMENRDFDRIKDTVKYQGMTDEERAYADDQQRIYNQLKSLGPQVLAQLGFISDASGNIRAITDREASSILPPDQLAIMRARNEEARALGSGTLPDYMKRELDTTNQAVLGASNIRLGPGGYYTSTPGNTALNQVQQNTAETVSRNRGSQVGLINSLYQTGMAPSSAAASYGTGLLGAGQGILTNVHYPFHNWNNTINLANIGATGGIVSQMIAAQGKGMTETGKGISQGMQSGFGGKSGGGGGGGS